ncbi:MAG: hypothetical protein U1G08_19545 [Verrucomicrobiota bacterium]
MPESEPKPVPGVLEKIREIALPSPVLALDVEPDGRTLYAGGHDGALAIIPVESGAPELVPRHNSYCSGVRRVPGTPWVVTGGYDGRLCWTDVGSRSLVREVRAHDFWSWDLAVSTDGRWIASVTGRYEAGGYRYEPAPGRELGVRVFDAATGAMHRSWDHIPPVQSVALSPDGRFVAAGNLMGEVRVWDRDANTLASSWRDDGLTSWGVIKSHHFLGGIFSMMFSPNGKDLYVCGMGPMVDPMAGNGVQRWQRFDWRTGKRLDQTHDGESGQGLMEALAFHPDGTRFAMAGRLFQGTWNLALFDSGNGKNLHAVDAKHRITGLKFSPDGSRLFLSKARGQEKPKDGRWKESGLVEIYTVRG